MNNILQPNSLQLNSFQNNLINIFYENMYKKKKRNMKTKHFYLY
jgi:hypothetical protein